jgi:chromosome partitioning protein
MQIITTAIIKGGTGKSTTAAALAQAAAKAGQKVLCIDLDPQANLSFFIGADQTRPGCFELLHGSDPAEVIQKTAQGLDAITASPDLATEKTTPGSAKRLHEAIEPLKKKYSFIFIDTPPQMGELTYNALQASTGLLIPVETDNSSLQGLYQIKDIATQIKKSNPDLSFIGIILTRYDPRPKINQALAEIIKKTGEEIGAQFMGTIRAGVAVREAQILQQSLFDYAPKCKPAADYMELYNKIKRRKG